MNYERWLNLMQKLGISENRKMYLSLQDAYSEKHRFYHNTTHIKAVLQHFDSALTLLTHPAEVETALWFHDAIYKPLSSQNELDSAHWAAEFLENNQCTQQIVDRVFSLIIATSHNKAAESNDEQLIVDIDLTILGSPDIVYQQFEENVRQEYKWVPWFLYRKKRKEILLDFLSREKIYANEFFYNQFEKQARINLLNAIVSL